MEMQYHVLEYLEQTVNRVPDKTAYSDGKDALTFREVYDESRAIGTYLSQEGLYHEPVVVFMSKHPKTIAAFLGVIYSGCYYVPIDDEMPLFRIELIFENLNPKAVICDEASVSSLLKLGYAGQVYRYDAINRTPEDSALLDQIRDRQIDTDPIYVVFTSGSTGVPKGVVACHRSVLDYIEALSSVLGLDEQTVFGMQVPLYFDACLKEIFPTLKFGATTYLIPKNLFMFPVRLVSYLNTYEINTLCWVVSALTMISAFGTFDKVVPKYLRTVAFGSEVMPIRQLNRWRKALPEARFINLYGPTEATGMSCYYEVGRDFEEGDIIPIGKPFRNTDLFLLDENNRVPKRGETGEICIRGTALTMGYYRSFDKTAEVFVQNPLNDAYPELIYRTGDIGCYNERGELLFISRKDHQIKHMGHRIELGEIEANVNRIDGVNMACCVYDQDSKRIFLYYVGDLTPGELMSALRDRLPRYMLPNAIEQLELMPLTTNAKIDRVALREKIGQKGK
ncbi:MAG: amino acid adenylation domain-containing protein [Clostridia bacterium]|nr:amino acid adenylation domain-containing protein [Clostridia bacterium]